jgi:predicted amidohydrolase
MEDLKVTACQIDIKLGDLENNYSRIVSETIREANDGSRLIVFPECALTGYYFDSEESAWDAAESIDSPHFQQFREMCGDLEVYMVVGFVESDGNARKNGGAIYNSAALIGPDSFLHVYRKVHLWPKGIDLYVKPSGQGFKVADLPIGKIGLSICYDHSFPESARVMALDGAQLIITIVNWSEDSFGPKITTTRAWENGVFYMAVNRVGEEGGERFCGASCVVDWSGKTIACGGDDEEILSTYVDLSEVPRARIENEASDRLKDRRPGFYGRLTKK